MAKQTFTTGQVLTAAQMTSLQETAMGGGPATAKTASYVLVAADAGTTVAMNAAGATTITVNTGLFAAGDTVFIQNLGAGACTVTAGTATVATAGSLILPQNDAGILYFTSASTAIFYDYIQTGAASPLTTKGDLYGYSTSDTRIPIGANATVLTADSTETLGLKWATPAAPANSYALINTGGTSLSGSTTTITGISGKNSLAILITGLSLTGTQDIGQRLRFNTDSGSNYFYAIVGRNNSNVASESSDGATAIFLGVPNAAANTADCLILVEGCNGAGQKVMSYTFSGNSTGTNAKYFSGHGRYTGSSTISSISIVTDSETYDAGTVFVYGA